MTASLEIATVQLRDGTERIVDTAQVRAAAQRWTATRGADTGVDASFEPGNSEEGGAGDTAEDGRVTILVEGAPFEALPLIAAAIEVDTDLLRPRSALTALDTLGFTFKGRPPIPHHHVNTERDAGADSQTSSDGDPDDDATTVAYEDTEVDETDDADEGAGGGNGARDGAQAAPTMSVQLARSLQRHRGQWVAIRDDKLVGYASTLGALRAAVGPEVVSVQFVPARPGASE